MLILLCIPFLSLTVWGKLWPLLWLCSDFPLIVETVSNTMYSSMLNVATIHVQMKARTWISMSGRLLLFILLLWHINCYYDLNVSVREMLLTKWHDLKGDSVNDIRAIQQWTIVVCIAYLALCGYQKWLVPTCLHGILKNLILL